MSGSKNFTINAPFFQEIKEDHVQLHELLDKVRCLASHRPALPNHSSEFAERLFQLCDQLALHFALEEAYGYMEDIVQTSPHLHSRTGRLREQHTTLFVMVRDLADRAASRHKGATEELMQIADRFVAFDEALKAHESAELKLILSSMNQVEGGSD